MTPKRPSESLSDPKRVPAEGEHLAPRALKSRTGDYKIDPETGCWIWQHGLAKGYGTGSFKSAGIDTNHAHRAYYIAAHGPLAPGVHLHHLCHRPACVNPDHLEPLVPVRHLQHHMRERVAKLTLEQVAEIRERVAAGEYQSHLAEEFGVTHRVIWQIRMDTKWRDDPDAPSEPIASPRSCLECGVDISTHRHGKKFCCKQHREQHGARRARQARRSALGLDPNLTVDLRSSEGRVCRAAA